MIDTPQFSELQFCYLHIARNISLELATSRTQMAYADSTQSAIHANHLYFGVR